jgi:hypothetical protein
VLTALLAARRWLKRHFFLAGYRVFVRFRTPEGRTVRGLRILRSDAKRARMVVGGNLLTHCNYHRCQAAIAQADGRIHVAVTTHDGGGDLDVIADPPFVRIFVLGRPA